MSKGRIFLVGFGPGAEAHMTQRAREAIAASDVVIGYATYIKLVTPLLSGKRVIRKGMTEEIDRCVEAHAHAREGRTVALISSGDIGIYGMAGPTYEVLLQAGWHPDSDIEVEVVPGATALSACAALVGAPLTHDFCAISLSDLLTPWPVIARRLEAAARADFVVALYNPKSGRRTGQIVEAQRILLRHRAPDTPVAVVKSAYRPKQSIQATRLADMADCEIGMLSTVLIGNRSTYRQAGLMITPRGYANKYDGITGALKSGERAGRSLSMGLDGWPACVRAYLSAMPSSSLSATAQAFDVSIGEVLSAIGGASATDPAGGYVAAGARPGTEIAVLEAARRWGRLCLAMHHESGIAGELQCAGDDLYTSGEQMELVTAQLRMHIDLTRIHRIWFARCGEQRRSVYGVDAAGAGVFTLSLDADDQDIDPQAAQRFDQDWRTLTHPTEMELLAHG